MLRSATVLAALACPLAAAAQPVPTDVVWARAAGAHVAAFSPDGQHVATGGFLRVEDGHHSGRLDLFAAADGAPLAHREVHGGAGLGTTGGVAFAPGGATLVSVHGDTYCEETCAADRVGLFTWAVPGLAPLLAGEVDAMDLPRSVAVAPVGSALAVGASGGDGGELLRVYDGVTLEVEHDLFGDTYATMGVAFSPDGQTLASAGTVGYLKLWDVATGALLRQVRHGQHHLHGVPGSIAFSPDGSRVATGGYGSDLHVKVWRAADLALLLDLDAQGAPTPGSSGGVVVAFSPNGAYVVGGPVRRADGVAVIRFWDAVTGAVVREYVGEGSGGVTSLAFSPGQDHLFAYTSGYAGEGTVRVARTDLHLAATPTAGESGPAGAAAARLTAGPNPSAAPALLLEVAAGQHVRAEAFDALGRRVALLHDGAVAPGTAVRLALDAVGLAPGPYVVRVVGETFTAARTVTVAR